MRRLASPHLLTTFALAALTATALLSNLFWWFLAAAFIGNFSLSNLWHLFVLVYTFAFPPAALAAYVIYGVWPSRRSALWSLLLSLVTLATYFIWTNKLSSGLIH